MLKRIAVDDLRPGMFVEELCGSWMDHPFWRARFVLEDPADLQRVRDSGIREVWIDIARGADVDGAAATTAVTREQADAEIDRRLSRAAEGEAPGRRSLQDEILAARRIVREAQPAVISMFNEARLGRAIDQHSAQDLVQTISQSVVRNPGALLSVARLKTADQYTFMHSVAVSGLMIALARQLGLADDEVNEAGMAGLLHDLGKARIPNQILNKPGALTDPEFAAMKRHPGIGHELLRAGGGSSAGVLDVCLHHHERVDGSGYPDRLAGDCISVLAKMGAVCDVYDAITSNRPYKAGWDPAEAVRKMAGWASSHFDPRIFQAFVKTVGIYPIGSLVRMESGRLGVVVEQNPSSLTLPQVRVFFSTRSNLRIAPELIDLSRRDVRDRIASREDPARWSFSDLETLWQIA